MSAPRTAKDATRGLTLKQEVFVKEYLVDFNATRAARAAGYSEKSAEVTGSRMLRNAKVQAEIDRQTQNRVQKLEITTEKIMQETARIAFANVLDYLTVDAKGARFDLSKVHRERAAAIQDIVIDSSGCKGRSHLRVKLADKLSALAMLGRWLGLDLKPTAREINDLFRGRSIEDLTYFAHRGYFSEDADPKLQSNPSKTSSGQPGSDFNNTEKLGCGLEGINSGK